MAFVQIIDNKIVALFIRAQPDIENIEEIQDDDARISDFLNPPKTVFDKIIALEQSVPPRRLQGALGGNAEDIAFIQNIEAQKVELRKQL